MVRTLSSIAADSLMAEIASRSIISSLVLGSEPASIQRAMGQFDEKKLERRIELNSVLN